MCPASRMLLYRRSRIATLSIDDNIGPQASGVVEFSVVNIDRAYQQAHGLCILDGKVSQAASTRYGYPFTWLCFGFLDPFVGGDAPTKNGGRFCCGETCRDMRNVIGIGKDELG